MKLCRSLATAAYAAALAHLENPTPEMIEAGWQQLTPYEQTDFDKSAAAIFTAMIRAAK